MRSEVSGSFTAIAVPDSWDQIGTELSVKGFDVLGLLSKYTKGAEDGVQIRVMGKLISGSSDKWQLGVWKANAAGDTMDALAQILEIESTQNAPPANFDVTAVNYVDIEVQMKGSTTPDGTIDMSWIKTCS